MRGRTMKFKVLALFAASIAIGIAFACGSGRAGSPDPCSGGGYRSYGQGRGL